MFQFVVPGPLPSHKWLKRHCLADPDALIKLAEQANRVNSPIGELCDRFSQALNDLRMGGAWKRTMRGRLKKTEAMLCSHIPENLQHDLTFLDVGASDGVTTVEAVRTLRRTFGGNIRAYLADLNICLLRFRRGPVVEYRAANGEPIMVRLGRFGLRLADPRRENAGGTVSPLVQLYLQRQKFRSAMQLDKTISLVSPLTSLEPDISTIEFDCLRRANRFEGHIAAIRASNVLNFGYFGSPQICHAISHFHAYLREGGCLVISQNDDSSAGERENGSVWIKEGKHFRWIEDFGTGSVTRPLVDTWSDNGETDPYSVVNTGA